MDLEFHQLDLRYAQLRSQQPVRERRLLASIDAHGQQVPIVVCPEAGRHIVVDGYKRVRALKKLHADTVAALSWSLAPQAALIVARLMCNAPSDTALEQGWCLQHLKEECGLTEAELALRFDRSVSWVNRRMALVSRLPDEIMALMRRGRIGGFAAQKYLVPLARANSQHAKALAKWIAEAQPSTRLIGEVYAAWQRSGGEARQWLVDNPGLFEKTQQERARAEHPDAHEAVLKDAALVAVVARRAQARAREVPWPPPQRQLLHARVEEARAQLERLTQVARGAEEQAHVG